MPIERELSELEQTRLVREHRLLRERVEREHGFGVRVGSGAAMQAVFDTIRKVAETDLTVLVRGESGTGKELVAQALHENSSRRSRPFVAVNCAAISRELVESEPFGHERGAFTGADARRTGKFEAADGGTLFLDEIGDMPAAVLATGDAIEPDDRILSRRGVRPSAVPRPIAGVSFQDSKKEAVTEYEREYLSAALKEHDGNVSRTAEAIGMARQSLQAKIKELGLRGTDISCVVWIRAVAPSRFLHV